MGLRHQSTVSSKNVALGIFPVAVRRTRSIEFEFRELTSVGGVQTWCAFEMIGATIESPACTNSG